MFRKRLLDPTGRAHGAAAADGRRHRGAASVAERARAGRRPPLDPVDEVYEALVLGTRDYVRKNGFTDVVIGLSGGIDSSLVAAHRRRRPRRRARARRVDAVAVLERGLA